MAEENLLLRSAISLGLNLGFCILRSDVKMAGLIQDHVDLFLVLLFPDPNHWDDFFRDTIFISHEIVYRAFSNLRSLQGGSLGLDTALLERPRL